MSPELLEKLLVHIERDPSITYYVLNKAGDLRTNTHSEGPNAVTWGVFPGKEIIQPTIVEAVSFMAWKASSRAVCNIEFLLITLLSYRTRLMSWASNGLKYTMRIHRRGSLSVTSWRRRC